MIITTIDYLRGRGRHVFHIERGDPSPCTGQFCDRCHRCAGPGLCRECNREAMKQEAK